MLHGRVGLEVTASYRHWHTDTEISSPRQHTLVQFQSYGQFHRYIGTLQLVAHAPPIHCRLVTEAVVLDIGHSVIYHTTKTGKMSVLASQLVSYLKP